jgi:hypothetical protein
MFTPAPSARVRTVDGRELWISITGARVCRPDGQVTGTVLITREVTARRALERTVAEQATAADRRARPTRQLPKNWSSVPKRCEITFPRPSANCRSPAGQRQCSEHVRLGWGKDEQALLFRFVLGC